MVKPFVLGIIEKEGKYLLLKRINPPKIWSPPGGWLDIGERPEEGLLREIKEESNLEVEVISPIHIFYKNRTNSLGLVYLCRYVAGQVKISFEHFSFIWKTLEEMKTERIECSPSIEVFEKGKRILSCLEGN